MKPADFTPVKEQQLCLPLPKQYKLVHPKYKPISCYPCNHCSVYEECHKAFDPSNTEPINQKLLSLMIDCVINDDPLCYIVEDKG